ncbi:hypothetical protein ACIRG5_34170 [Lentzea sp. NPDC102401]|uniref:hypothetical protein n=1 Tax=Lentzea sp. NPDC102401 TaxID=3364128 RepID=UPI0038054EAB
MHTWEVRLWLFVLCVGVLAAVAYGLVLRGRRKAEHARLVELTEFAESLGGTAADRRTGARPWSADLTRAMASQYGTVLKWLGRASGSSFDYALDFSRNGWRVRVSEASMEVATSTSTRTAQETRIEVATADLVPLKITQSFGGGLGGRWAREMPRTVESEDRPLWMPLRLPVSVDHAYVAFTSDLVGAAHVFNPCLESGIAYTVLDGPIHPRFLSRKVDAIIDLLSLVPGSQRGVTA